MNVLLTTLLALGSLACQAATVAQDAADTVAIASDGPDDAHSQLSVVKDGNALSLVVAADDMSATLNGKPVPDERIVRNGDRLSVLDEDGKVVFDVRVLEGGGLLYPFEGNAVSRFAADSLRVDSARYAFPRAGGRHKLIGVTTTSVKGVLADQLGLEPDSAFVINSVRPGKPADLAGLEVNDIVVAIEGESPANTGVLREHIEELEAGDELRLSVLRHGEPQELTLTLQEPDSASYSVDLVAPNIVWRSGEADVPWDVSFVTTVTKDAMERRQRELVEVERRLADVHAQLEVRLADLHDAQAAGEQAAPAGEREEDAVRQLEQAMEQLQDVSAVLRAQSLGSAREVGIASAGKGGSRRMYVPRTAIETGAHAGARAPAPEDGVSAALSERLDRMEDRMARLEELLERLVESGNGR